MGISTQSLPRLARPSAEQRLSPRLVLVGVLLVLAHLPLLVLHGEQLWLRAHYQFFPMALASAAVLAYRRWPGAGKLQPGSRLGSTLALVLSWLLLAAATLLYSPWLGAWAALFTLAALAYVVGGSSLLRVLTPSWVMLLLTIPPPLNLDQKLIIRLQSLTSRWSSGVLDLLGTFHVVSGNVVETNGKHFGVEEACSGIHSLFAVLACTLLFIFWVGRPRLHALLLVVSAMGWVLLGNIGRVVGVIYGDTRWGLNLGEGWRHETLGFILFALMLLFIASTDQLLLFLLSGLRPHDEKAPVPATPAHAGANGDSLPSRGVWARLSSRLPDLRHTTLAAWPVGLVYGLLAACQAALLVPVVTTPAQPRVRDLASLGADLLPAQWGNWQRQAFEIKHRERDALEGEYSHTWRYQNGQESLVISLDFPFAGWHELCDCYNLAGWQIQEQATLHGSAGSGSAGDVMEVRLHKPVVEKHSYLLYQIVDSQGHALERPPEGLFADLYARVVTNNLARRSGAVAPGQQQASYQIQLNRESYQPLTAAEQQDCQAFFRHIVNILADTKSR